MAAQAACDVRQDHLLVLKFDREGRTRKDLFDRPEELERRFFVGGIGRRRARAPLPSRTAAGYGRSP
jgi:hypothetical protein